MKTIASFTVNHDKLEKGMYLSRVDGDVVTYDVRMKKPNGGDYLGNGELHTIEHLFATYARNSNVSNDVVYVGPMGCRTGFYLLVRDSVSNERAVRLVRDSLEYISGFEGEIPGSKRAECGNYAEHDLDGAKKTAKDMLNVLKNWKPEDLKDSRRNIHGRIHGSGQCPDLSDLDLSADRLGRGAKVGVFAHGQSDPRGA